MQKLIEIPWKIEILKEIFALLLKFLELIKKRQNIVDSFGRAGFVLVRERGRQKKITKTFQGGRAMTIYNLYIFDKYGILLYYAEWNRIKQSGITKEEVCRVIFALKLSQNLSFKGSILSSIRL